MLIARSTILELLRERHLEGADVIGELPDPVDTDLDGGLLAQLGVSGWDLERHLEQRTRQPAD